VSLKGADSKLIPPGLRTPGVSKAAQADVTGATHARLGNGLVRLEEIPRSCHPIRRAGGEEPQARRRVSR